MKYSKEGIRGERKGGNLLFFRGIVEERKFTGSSAAMRGVCAAGGRRTASSGVAGKGLWNGCHFLICWRIGLRSCLAAEELKRL